MSRLSNMDYPAYYETYVGKVDGEKSLVQNLNESKEQALAFLNSLAAIKENYAYAEGKWTVKEVLQHCIDTERIFAMRALCFARKEEADLPGFDENKYAKHAQCEHRSFKKMIDEFEVVRNSSIFLFESLSNDVMDHKGTASNHLISVRAIGYILSGHIIHHLDVIKERYL